MTSAAEDHQSNLEERGEYVVRANARWFAIFPKTLLSRVALAKRDGRNAPNLIVYTTNTADARAHYVIPEATWRDLLVESTLTTSTVNGTRRWNLTLTDGQLHVSHRPGVVDVSRFRGLPLLTESREALLRPSHPVAIQTDEHPRVLTSTVLASRLSERNAIERAVRRMASTARATAAAANGEPTQRTNKNKDLHLEGDALEAHIRAIVEAQYGRCALTDLVLAFDGDSQDFDLLCSLDRIDSTGHYAVGNLQVVCRFANRWKSDDSDDNFRRLLSLVREAGDSA